MGDSTRKELEKFEEMCWMKWICQRYVGDSDKNVSCKPQSIVFTRLELGIPFRCDKEGVS